MNKAFENILERLDEEVGFYNSASDSDEYITEGIYISKRIVQEVAEEYIQKFPLDTKRRIAEMYAHHMVNYGIDVTSKWETAVQQAYALEKAYIRGKQEERDRIYEHIKEHNNDWILCSERLPEECIEVIVSVKEIDGSIYTRTSWVQGGVWVIKKTPLNPTVIAWQPLPSPYKEK